jgi:hypothetical protein
MVIQAVNLSYPVSKKCNHTQFIQVSSQRSVIVRGAVIQVHGVVLCTSVCLATAESPNQVCPWRTA